MRAKTPEERAHVDLDTHYTQVNTCHHLSIRLILAQAGNCMHDNGKASNVDESESLNPNIINLLWFSCRITWTQWMARSIEELYCTR